jgi:hypothetical protein
MRTMSHDSKNDKNEQIRAIFVLGLLAVLASIRTQNASLMAPIGKQSFDIIPIIDVMIFLMSFYSLFMIFGYSRDMVGENLANMFRQIARSFLIMNFLILVAIGVILSIAYYQNRLLWFLGILAIPVVYLTYRKLKTFKPKINLKSKKEKKSFGLTMILLGLIFSVLEIIYYSPEEFVPFFFVLGAICMIIFLYFSSKKKSEQKKLEDPASEKV